jgi:ABC-type transport system involved in multi-copper enzyme maturation permease subunit
MLWYKSWIETRWRFLIGLGLLMCSAAGIVFFYPQVIKLLPLVPAVEISGELGRQIKEAAELARDYRGYVWSQWFSQTPTQLGVLFAALLGTGGLLSSRSGDETLFTLSLPVSRDRLLGIRAATGLGEWLAIAFVPSLLIPLFSPAVGETYGIGSALTHGLCLFLAGAVFFSLALLLSTMFGDLWRPLLISVAAAIALASCEFVFRDVWPYGIFTLMRGEYYFRTGSLPWGSLLASIVLSAAMLYSASVSIARRDF